jgi:Uma2 family endonuclease
MASMRAVLVDAESEIDRRRRLGIDKKDELWDGVWHLVNAPKVWHQRLNLDMGYVLLPLARGRGLEPLLDSGVIDDIEKNFRIPDQIYARPADVGEDGVTSAGLVVEVRSPRDESYEKLPFYAERGVTEVLIVHQDRRFELYRLAEGEYHPAKDGRSTVLGVTFSTVDGPKLRIAWDGGSADV